MRILILSRTAWRKDNSFGNTYSNIFGNMDDVEIANVYLGDGFPDVNNKNVVSYYQISERSIVSRFLHFNIGKKVGKQVFPQESETINPDNKGRVYSSLLKRIKQKRWSIFFIIREIAWRFGKVDYSNLNDFLDEFKPDIIFLSFYYAAYVDRVALYIKKRLNIPMVLEAAVDIYSLKQVSFDPLFWINRFYIRSMIRRTVSVSDKLYVISEKMKTDYTKFFDIPCEVLYKSYDSRRKINRYYLSESDNLVFLFTGNVSYGRWISLGYLGKAIKKMNVGRLDIYTATPLTTKMKKMLSECEVHPPVSESEVLRLQNSADILVHVESFKLKDKLEVRYSISTKIMDYISSQRCILAIGPADIASIEFLAERKVAIIVNRLKDIERTISEIANNREMISTVVNNSEQYVSSALSVAEASNNIKKDLNNLITSYKHSQI